MTTTTRIGAASALLFSLILGVAHADTAVPDLEARRATLNNLLKEQWEYTLRTSPEWASLLGDKRYQLVTGEQAVAKKRGAKAGGKPLAEELSSWEAAGLHCSANERRADEASRDVEAWLKCKYMREHLGEEYSGVVTAVTGFGLFVTLDSLYVEGLVHITELGAEYFRFDEARQELRGERTGIRYAIGTRVQIQVSRVDLDGRKIDFRLVHPGDVLLSRAMRDKGTADAGQRQMDRKSKTKGAAASSRSLPAEHERSPIQALRASVKKAASRKRDKGKSARKSRR